jgi:PST family polysaccharide transporter
MCDGVFRLLIVLTSLYVARTLSIEGFGYFALGQAIGAYLVVLMDLSGNSTYAIREVAQNRSKAVDIISRFLSVRVISAIAIIFISQLLIQFLEIKNQLLKVAILFSAIHPLVYALFPDWAFRGLERIKVLTIGYGIMAFTYLGLVLMYVRSNEDITLLFLAWTLSYFFGGIVLIILLRFSCGLYISPNFAAIQNFKGWKSSLHFTLAGLLGISLSQGILLIVSILAGPIPTGLFAAPLRIILAISTAGVMIPNAVYPILASLKENPQEFGRISSEFAKWMFLISVPIAVTGTVWADQIIKLILGAQYVDVNVVFCIMIWTIPTVFIIYAYEYTLLAGGFEGKRLSANVVAVITLAVFGFPLIYIYGEVGAAWAYLISIVSLFLSLNICIYGFHKTSSFYIPAFKAILLLSGFYALEFAFRQRGIGLLGILLSISCYIAVVIIVRFIKYKDLKELYMIFSKQVRQARYEEQ